MKRKKKKKKAAEGSTGLLTHPDRPSILLNLHSLATPLNLEKAVSCRSCRMGGYGR